MTDRYVISVRTAGVGDCIICLGAAWRFARAAKRILVADWRRSLYTARKDNLFPLCFENTEDIAGIPFISDDRIHHLMPRRRTLKIARWIPFGWRHAMIDRDRAVALIRSGGDIEASTVIFEDCINDGLDSFEDARTFLGGLRPAARLASAVAAFEHGRLQAGPWIGLHIRHGNGGDIMGHKTFWTSFDLAIARCVQAVGKARERLGAQAIVLLCTDSLEVQNAILKRVPRVVCREKSFREPGAGELHLGDDASSYRDEALIEMLLLARCSALIRYPAGSFFSFYAAVMKKSGLPPPATIYDLQNSCDPDDEFAPALLF